MGHHKDKHYERHHSPPKHHYHHEHHERHGSPPRYHHDYHGSPPRHHYDHQHSTGLAGTLQHGAGTVGHIIGNALAAHGVGHNPYPSHYPGQPGQSGQYQHGATPYAGYGGYGAPPPLQYGAPPPVGNLAVHQGRAAHLDPAL